MNVVFESRIKYNRFNEVYIELKDLVDGRVEICSDLEDYAKKIEKLGKDYSGKIDTVNWFVDDNVPQEEIDKIALAMEKYKEDI